MLSFVPCSPSQLSQWHRISTVERNNNKNRISLVARTNRKRFSVRWCHKQKKERASEVTFMSPMVVHNAFNKLDYHLMLWDHSWELENTEGIHRVSTWWSLRICVGKINLDLHFYGCGIKMCMNIFGDFNHFSWIF